MTDSGSPTFAIMGSGGMGGYIGAKLTQAGYKVSFVARSAHLEAMNAYGFKIEGPDEAFVIKPIRATSDPSEIGPVDIVVFCVKLWDTESAAAQCQELIGPDTAVLSMQNGVDPEPVLSDILGREHVMGAVAEVGANVVEPGFVRRFSPLAIIRFGELDQSRSARSMQFAAAIAAAGFEADQSLRKWSLVVSNLANRLISGAARPLRIAIHPYDFTYLLSSDLQTLLEMVDETLDYHDLFD